MMNSFTGIGFFIIFFFFCRSSLKRKLDKIVYFLFLTPYPLSVSKRVVYLPPSYILSVKHLCQPPPPTPPPGGSFCRQPKPYLPKCVSCTLTVVQVFDNLNTWPTTLIICFVLFFFCFVSHFIPSVSFLCHF